MRLDVQKRVAADILGCSKNKVKLDTKNLAEIKEAITRADIKGLIGSGLITREQDQGISRARAKARQSQKAKGRQRGQGKRKGKHTARQPRKRTWINKVRLQRKFLRSLKEKELISGTVNRELYLKVKGGFFRSLRHLKLYIQDHNLVQVSKK